jgi:hypothetical protein
MFLKHVLSKSMRLKLIKHVARIKGIRTSKQLLAKSGSDHLEDWYNKFKLDLREIVYDNMNWLKLSQHQ